MLGLQSSINYKSAALATYVHKNQTILAEHAHFPALDFIPDSRIHETEELVHIDW